MKTVTGLAANILYIEDDPASKKLMQSLVDNYQGLHLITAWSAEEGIRLATEHRPPLIFLDINLPCMCGREAIRHLRDLEQLSGSRIYALSADAIPAHIDSAMKLGFDGYITKPVDLKMVTDIFDEMFSSAADHPDNVQSPAKTV